MIGRPKPPGAAPSSSRGASATSSKNRYRVCVQHWRTPPALACSDGRSSRQPYAGKCKDCKQSVTQNQAKYCHGALFVSAISAFIQFIARRLCVQEGNLLYMRETDPGHLWVPNGKQVIDICRLYASGSPLHGGSRVVYYYCVYVWSFASTIAHLHIYP